MLVSFANARVESAGVSAQMLKLASLDRQDDSDRPLVMSYRHFAIEDGNCVMRRTDNRTLLAFEHSF